MERRRDLWLCLYLPQMVPLLAVRNPLLGPPCRHGFADHSSDAQFASAHLGSSYDSIKPVAGRGHRRTAGLISMNLPHGAPRRTSMQAAGHSFLLVFIWTPGPTWTYLPILDCSPWTLRADASGMSSARRSYPRPWTMTSTAWLFSSHLLLSAESLGRGRPRLAARLCCLFYSGHFGAGC
ncbi:hypothetical protein B0I37DRAFT_52939 [Chaetomium sp. MPI-CAGE-AT-0009]|nr:hypothetical protein B0I37DRAFT_52939 [Chaetomium sp. MPI-CAGE-AT-0009]